jgi:hypothetical protein
MRPVANPHARFLVVDRRVSGNAITLELDLGLPTFHSR